MVLDRTTHGLTRRSILAGAAGTALGAMTAGSASATTTSTNALWGVPEWKAKFDAKWGDAKADAISRSTSNDSYRFYHVNSAVDAAVSMAEATASRAFIDEALLFTTNMMDTAVPCNTLLNSGYYEPEFKGWVGSRTSPGKQVSLDEAITWRYVTRMLRVIRNTPAFYNATDIRAKYNEVLAFTEQHIFRKWYTRSINLNPPMGTQSDVYRNRTHIAAHWAYIALNLGQLTQDSALQGECQTVVDNINLHMPNFPSSLREQMQLRTGSFGEYYFWDWIWDGTDPLGSDVSHGSHVVSYCIESAEQGAEWNATDMNRFVTLFDKVLWPSPGVYAQWVNGQVGTQSNQVFDGWVKLGRFSPALQERLQGGHAPSEGTPIYACQFYAGAARNASLLVPQYRRPRRGRPGPGN